MANELTPRKANFSLSGLQAASQQIGSGGGSDGRYLKVNHKSGALTVGQGKPFNTEILYGIRVEEIRFGYYIFEGKGSPDKTHMVPLISGKPKPIPAEPYAVYPAPGPQDITEIRLHPIGEPGGPIEFGPTSTSSQNRIGNLVDDIMLQEQKPAGQVGFVNPLIKVSADFWSGDYGDTWFFDYEIKDWTDASGELLQSEWEKTAQVADQSDAVIEEAPEDEGDFDPMG